MTMSESQQETGIGLGEPRTLAPGIVGKAKLYFAFLVFGA